MAGQFWPKVPCRCSQMLARAATVGGWPAIPLLLEARGQSGLPHSLVKIPKGTRWEEGHGILKAWSQKSQALLPLSYIV